jgi:hypothetical protein
MGWGRSFSRDAAVQGATFDSWRQLVRPLKKSLCNFDHLAKSLQSPSPRQSTIFIDQTPNRPACKVWVQAIVTNVIQIGRLYDEALAR